jgi:ABC-type protease/lipase transport system fused ATPase/permease subunit
MQGGTHTTPKEARGACRRAYAHVVSLFSMCINILMLTVPLYMLEQA